MRCGLCWYGQAVVNRPDAGSIPAPAACGTGHGGCELTLGKTFVHREKGKTAEGDNHMVNYSFNNDQTTLNWKDKPTGDGSCFENSRACVSPPWGFNSLSFRFQ